MFLKYFINKENKLPIIVILAIVSFLSFNILNKNFFKNIRFDLTKSNIYTLSDGTKSVLSSIKEPINFKLFYTKQIGDANPTYQNYYNKVSELLEQYVLLSNNRIKLKIYNPEPFSDEEDKAIEYGLQGIEILQGVYGYFGLVATNSTDDEEKIFFFDSSRESFLEYDLSKIVSNLSNPNRRVIGLYTNLPIQGTFNPRAKTRDAATTPPWIVYNQIEEFFEVKRIHEKTKKIPDELGLIVIIHPQEVPDRVLYMFDQFVLRGGKLLIFLDPNAEVEKFRTEQQTNTSDSQQNSSTLKKLLDNWGVELIEDKVVGDLLSARRVSIGTDSQPSVTDYIAWLDIKKDNIDKSHQATSKVNNLTFATAGILKENNKNPIQFKRLVWSTKQSMQIDSKEVQFNPDPTTLLRNFVPSNEEFVLVAEINGNFVSNFFDGPPKTRDNFNKEEHLQNSVTKSTLIIVSDVDMLYDEYWIRFEQSGAAPIANNADFTVNLLEYLNGTEDLIGLRGKGTSLATFTKVEKIQKEAEQKYRSKEQELLEKLNDYQQRLENIQSGKKNEEEKDILSKDETLEIEKFRSEMIKVRNELRQVQNALRVDIEKLDSRLKFLNIFVVPILLVILSVILGLIRRKKRHEKYIIKETD